MLTERLGEAEDRVAECVGAVLDARPQDMEAQMAAADRLADGLAELQPDVAEMLARGGGQDPDAAFAATARAAAVREEARAAGSGGAAGGIQCGRR